MKHKSVTFAGSAASPDQFPRDGLPEVAFLGRSNVGKSSLLNALAGVRGLARVSSDPGRTRLVNFFRVSGAERPGGAGRGDLYLVDLPGYGYVKASRDVRESFERIAVSYLADREPLRLCVFIVDARHEPSERDQVLRAWLEEHGLPYVVAANKIDALVRGEAHAPGGGPGPRRPGRRAGRPGRERRARHRHRRPVERDPGGRLRGPRPGCRGTRTTRERWTLRSRWPRT